jgi:hypothetical protein
MGLAAQSGVLQARAAPSVGQAALLTQIWTRRQHAWLAAPTATPLACSSRRLQHSAGWQSRSIAQHHMVTQPGRTQLPPRTSAAQHARLTLQPQSPAATLTLLHAPGLPRRPRMAGFIGGSNDFFIAVADHRDWGGAFIVWGEVTDMTAVHTMLNLPFHEFAHPEFGTVMRMLNTAVPFNVTVMDKTAAAAEAVIEWDRQREAAGADRALEVGDLVGSEEGGGEGDDGEGVEDLSDEQVEGVEQGLGDVESA